MMGNLTKDPDYKQLSAGQGQPVCRLSLASNRQYRNKQTGLVVQEVCYIEVDVWGAQADNCRQYLEKGRPVFIEGRLKLDRWKDADGKERQKHSIVADKVMFLGGKQQTEALNNDEAIATGGQATRSGQFSQAAKTNELSGDALFKDEPPFEHDALDDLPF
jgi:single-strand DNA-binding protein